MKRILITLAAALTIFTACKNNTTTGGSDENAKYQKLYEKSMKLKDIPTAIYAIQMVLLTDSTNGLSDSLPELYAATNNIEACLQTTNESLKRHPKEEKYKNLKVLCLQQTGDIDSMFLLLEDLYKTTKKPQYIAQMASTQLAAGEIRQAMETVDFIIAEYRNNKTDSLDVMMGQNGNQRVPVMAAAYNMKGYIYMQQKNIDKAKEAYFTALEICPDFEMPKRNLEMIFARKY
jgi:tetratricopeptide (TPR) repeat protein